MKYLIIIVIILSLMFFIGKKMLNDPTETSYRRVRSMQECYVMGLIIIFFILLLLLI